MSKKTFEKLHVGDNVFIVNTKDDYRIIQQKIDNIGMSVNEIGCVIVAGDFRFNVGSGNCQNVESGNLFCCSTISEAKRVKRMNGIFIESEIVKSYNDRFASLINESGLNSLYWLPYEKCVSFEGIRNYINAVMSVKTKRMKKKKTFFLNISPYGTIINQIPIEKVKKRELSYILKIIEDDRRNNSV